MENLLYVFCRERCSTNSAAPVDNHTEATLEDSGHGNVYKVCDTEKRNPDNNMTIQHSV